MSAPPLQEFLAPNGFFRSLVDQSSLMLIVLDADGQFVYSSRARLMFHGRSPEQERGFGWTETVQAEERPHVRDSVRAAIAERRRFTVEYRAARADGEWRLISTQGMPWTAPDQTYLGHVAMSVDITDRQHVNDEKRDEPRQLRRLIENAHDMVYRTRFLPAHSIDYLGGAVVSITGHTAAEFYADPALAAKCVHPDDRRHLILNTLDDPSKTESVAILRWIHPDGRVVHAEHRRVPVYDEAGQLVAIEGIARNVTDFVEAQRRLRESEDQLRQLAARLDAAREAERAHVARELHDELGQTLTALKLDISRMAGAFSREQLTPQMVDRLQSLIGLSDIGLATVKRIATTLRPPTLDHLGLAEAIHWEALTFKARTGVRCTVRTNKTTSSLSGEQQTALFRILQEALTNVVRHAQASAVQVTLTERAERFEMTIRDNGRGISDAESGDPRAIGLLGMRERAALVGGVFRISGRRGKGTMISIEVPVARSATRARIGRKAKVVR